MKSNALTYLVILAASSFLAISLILLGESFPVGVVVCAIVYAAMVLDCLLPPRQWYLILVLISSALLIFHYLQIQSPTIVLIFFLWTTTALCLKYKELQTFAINSSDKEKINFVFQNKESIKESPVEETENNKDIKESRFPQNVVLDQIPKVIFQTDCQGQILYANQFGREMFSFDDRQNFGSLIKSQQEREIFLKTLEQYSNNKPSILKFNLKKKNGIGIIAQVQVKKLQVQRLSGENHSSTFMLLVEDKTEHHLLLTVIEQERKKFFQIAENLPLALWVTSHDQTYVNYVNNGYTQIWGKKKKTLLQDSQSWLEQVHQSDRLRVKKSLMESRSKQTFWKEEYHLNLPGNREIKILHRCFFVSANSSTLPNIVNIAEEISL